jgi:hypothetical protein
VLWVRQAIPKKMISWVSLIITTSARKFLQLNYGRFIELIGQLKTGGVKYKLGGFLYEFDEDGKLLDQ